MALTTAEHAQAPRERKERRNELARLRRRAAWKVQSPTLHLRLPGVVSWARPRVQPVGEQSQRTAYPPTYLAGREVWRQWVAGQVTQAQWPRPPVEAALAVVVEVVAGGRLDVDRVVSAVLDALQHGGAIKDDCRVWQLQARRRRPVGMELPHVRVQLSVVGDA